MPDRSFPVLVLVAWTGASIALSDASGERVRTEKVVIGGPSLASWQDDQPRQAAVKPAWKPTHKVQATTLNGVIYTKPNAYVTLGYARPGVDVPARRARGTRCPRGNWYEVAGGGFVCTSRGFAAKRGWTKRKRAASRLGGNISAALPFRYAKVKRELRRAPRLKRPATSKESGLLDEAIASGKRMSWIVTRWMEGAWFVPLVQRHVKDGKIYYEHTNGEFVRGSDLDALPPPTMRGVRLSKRSRLPIAFTTDRVKLRCLLTRKSCGVADRHARFYVEAVAKRGKRGYARGPRGVLAPLDKLRIARKIKPPAGVPTGAKWVHFDLDQQVFVAYEGKRPVYASLISSGAAGHATPAGLYRVERKYITKTMSGKDPDVGWYEVAEVPWTMFYDKNFAVHGAYWHNKFGNTKSHGCTNLAPVDARWLFFWGSVQLPPGWHAIKRQKGTWFYFTSDKGVSR